MESAEAGVAAQAERPRADDTADHAWQPPSAASLAFSPRSFVRLLGRAGVAGGWTWRFAGREQAWSAGMYRLLGLDPACARLDYDLFLRLLHPDDRLLCPTPEALRLGLGPTETVVRVIREDGTVRVLDIRFEMSCDPSGRPTEVFGTALDVTEREALRRAFLAAARRQRMLADRAHSFTYSVDVAGAYNPLDDIVRLSGLPADEVVEDHFLMIVADEREHWRALYTEARATDVIYRAAPIARLADGSHARVHAWNVPVRDGTGGIVDWAGFGTYGPVGRLPVTGQMLRGAEQAVQGVQFRAARALLDWSMTTLAAASGLSFSTVRRLEEDAEAASAASRHKAVAALRAAGIRFTLVADGHVAISRL